MQKAIVKKKLRAPYRFGLIDPTQYRARVEVAKRHKEMLKPVVGGLNMLNPAHLVTLLAEQMRMRTTYETMVNALMKSPEKVAEWAARLTTKGGWVTRVRTKIAGPNTEERDS